MHKSYTNSTVHVQETNAPTDAPTPAMSSQQSRDSYDHFSKGSTLHQPPNHGPPLTGSLSGVRQLPASDMT